MIGKVRNDALHSFTYFCLPASVHSAAHNVYLRHGQAWQRHLLVVVEKRQILQKGLGLKDHFGRVGSQNALIEALNRREGRLIPRVIAADRREPSRAFRWT